MIDWFLGVGLVVHALLLLFWPGRQEKPVPAAVAVVEEPKPLPRPKPFRARKGFREVRREFEDAHDPQRLSRVRVERFARRATEVDAKGRRTESSGAARNG